MNKEVPVVFVLQFFFQIGSRIADTRVFLEATYRVARYIHDAALPLLKWRAMRQNH